MEENLIMGYGKNKLIYHNGDYLGPNKDILLLERIKDKKGYGIFVCPLCGKIFSTSIDHVVRGHTKSCGCYLLKVSTEKIQKWNNEHIVDLRNKRFGKLTVLYKTNKKLGNNYYWHCLCDCGNEINVSGGDLQKGHTHSCGCVKSKGEMFIKNFLTQNNINFICQKSFEKCVNPKTNKKLYFDFYLPDYNTCIEYDGIQHYKYTESGWNTKEKFEETKYRDNIKNKFCKDNNIKLLRIPYAKQNKLGIQYIEKFISPIISNVY